MAMKLAFEGLKDSAYKTRDTAVGDVGGFQSVELSVLLCNGNFIGKLNKEWRDEDHATDVLSMSQHVAELNLPILMLGDIVISIETAQRQAEERGHTLLDEVRILMTWKRDLPEKCKPECLQRGLFLYSHRHQIPLIAFCEYRCLTLFEHPMVDSLHTVYSEPKAEIISSVEDLLSSAEIQKMIFLDTAEGVATNLRPHWTEVTGDRANVVQAVPDMLEIVPPETSKGSGVRMLLDHLGITAKEIMAMEGGENDVEMPDLASFGVALSNGSEKAKDVIGINNDEDGRPMLSTAMLSRCHFRKFKQRG